ncbi:hypothetical protein EUTSA_v10019536mg [Eutrema salsugineum]|uniref:Uncharacterized protein n=1 Tax=Eutrema salsugineum TaxID=72664 RepID=V4KAY7_EUTSA|nr:hypothetical protein EUTSA_v10019536mg [Eutrema salsugineum]
MLSRTSRIYHVAPTLLIHEASEDFMVAGYNVPQTFKGADQKLIPFEIERRACSWFGLAQRVVNLALGSLVQYFRGVESWKSKCGHERRKHDAPSNTNAV